MKADEVPVAAGWKPAHKSTATPLCMSHRCVIEGCERPTRYRVVIRCDCETSSGPMCVQHCAWQRSQDLTCLWCYTAVEVINAKEIA